MDATIVTVRLLFRRNIRFNAVLKRHALVFLVAVLLVKVLSNRDTKSHTVPTRKRIVVTNDAFALIHNDERPVTVFVHWDQEVVVIKDIDLYIYIYMYIYIYQRRFCNQKKRKKKYDILGPACDIIVASRSQHGHEECLERVQRRLLRDLRHHVNDRVDDVVIEPASWRKRGHVMHVDINAVDHTNDTRRSSADAFGD